MNESLVVVSNRLPYDMPREGRLRPPRRNVGGLVNALEPVLAARGGTWIGWDGVSHASSAATKAALAAPLQRQRHGGIGFVGVPLGEREMARYYHGLSNRALWPLLHDRTGKAVFRSEDWAAYETVNRRFAEIVLAHAPPGSRIWVHDYHLMRMPHALRTLGFDGRIDFFLHVPFPPPEIFRTFPWRDALLEGVLAADTVAFHVPLYRDNFAACARDLLGLEVRGDDDLVLSGGEIETAVLAAPIGVDVADFERLAQLPAVQARARRIRDAHPGCRVLFCADRLDYTKGIGERCATIERLLQLHSEWSKRVVLIQIVVPSRHQVEEYRALKRDIDREVGRINADHGRLGWVPIQYRYRALERAELVAHYRAADVALVTPLRDGMNLVAGEFAASRVDRDGVLVVSEFAGAAARSPGALKVNPYDLDGCAETIVAALALSPEERARRMRELRESVRSNPSSSWAARCLDHPAPRGAARGASHRGTGRIGASAPARPSGEAL